MKNNEGVTLVELVLVISILAILIVIAVPEVTSFVAKSKEKVCDINCSELEKAYNAHITTENLTDTGNIFEEYLGLYSKNICPSGGTIIYTNGEIKCSIHSKEADEEQDDVPYL